MAHSGKNSAKAWNPPAQKGKPRTGEDVAKTVLFLEENDYVTGADIPVNGGFSVV